MNTLSVNLGDFVPSFTQIAEVASNDALEISIFVGVADARQLAIGDAVTVDGQYEGTITSIAPALDPQTLKTEVKIATASDELINGDSVRVSITDTEADEMTGPIMVPLTAVKFTADAGTILVVEDGVLEAIPVAIGAIRGDLVTITEGITPDTRFVFDARGLTAGDEVETTDVTGS